MNKKIKYVYIAGILSRAHGYYSPNTAINYLVGVRELTKWGKRVLNTGLVPFVPAFDYIFWWVDSNDLTEETIKRYSMMWLERCDAILLTPGWEQSPGSIAELKRAKELGMPSFESIEAMERYNEKL